jgi:hypothetical protein
MPRTIFVFPCWDVFEWPVETPINAIAIIARNNFVLIRIYRTSEKQREVSLERRPSLQPAPWVSKNF